MKNHFKTFKVDVGVASDKNITVVKVICDQGKHLLLMSVYIPPINSAVEDSRRQTILNLSTTLSYLTEQFSSLPIVIYADLNSKCRENEAHLRTPHDKEVLDLITRNELQLVYSREQDDYTWSNSSHKSYIDYFLTKGVETSHFRIGDKIGSSDHRTLELQINNSQALVVRKVVKQSAKLARQLLPEFRQAIKLYPQNP